MLWLGYGSGQVTNERELSSLSGLRSLDREKVGIERAIYTRKGPRARNRDSAVDGGKTLYIAL